MCLVATCCGLQWKSVRLPIEHLPGPQALILCGASGPTLIAPEPHMIDPGPACLSGRLTFIETHRRLGPPSHHPPSSLTRSLNPTTLAPGCYGCVVRTC